MQLASSRGLLNRREISTFRSVPRAGFRHLATTSHDRRVVILQLDGFQIQHRSDLTLDGDLELLVFELGRVLH